MQATKDLLSQRMKEALSFLKSKGSPVSIHSQQDVADILGIDKATMSKIFSGTTGYLNPSRIASFNAAFGGIFNEAYLLGGEGTLLREQPAEAQRPLGDEVIPVPEENYMMAEYADLRVSAGLLGVGDVTQLPETHKRLLPREYEKGNYLVVRVSGDSMYDGTARSLVDGDEVLVKELTHDITTQLKDGIPIKNNLFVITTRDGNVLKQITEINREHSYIVCHSFNERYSDYKIPFEEVLQIFIVRKIVAKQITI